MRLPEGIEANAPSFLQPIASLDASLISLRRCTVGKSIIIRVQHDVDTIMKFCLSKYSARVDDRDNSISGCYYLVAAFKRGIVVQ